MQDHSQMSLLYKERLSRGYSVGDIARMSGLSRKHIMEIEAGRLGESSAPR